MERRRKDVDVEVDVDADENLDEDGGKLRLLAWLGCLAFAAWPFLVVTFPPLTDLPQHVAQVRFLFEESGGAESAYRVQWLTPYGLVYTLFAFAWKILPAISAARLGAYLVLASFISAVHFLAWRFNRPVAAAILASTLALNRSFYWGMFNFLFGFLIFTFWMMRLRSESKRPVVVRVLSAFGIALFLYLSHALWFAVGVGWMFLESLYQAARVRGALESGWHRALLVRSLGVMPVFLLAVRGFLSLQGTSMDTPTHFGYSVLLRLKPRVLSEVTFGGIRNSVELVCFVAIVLWLVVGFASAFRGRHKARVRTGHESGQLESSLLLLGVVFVVFYLVLPYRYTLTISFNERWFPMAVVLLLLAMPRLKLARALPLALSSLLFAGLITATVASWRSFEAQEMTGLTECLDALPEAQRILGLDFRRGSEFVDGLPFLHAAAWGQVLKGGRQNFSFSHFATSLVVDRDPNREIPWTLNLEWDPMTVKHSDYQYFDYLLIGASEAVHHRFSQETLLESVTSGGAFRLYRVKNIGPLRLSSVVTSSSLIDQAGLAATTRTMR